MTDPRPPLTDDELSGALDGETAPDVSARLAQDPAAQQRSAELRAVGDTLRSHPVAPLDPTTVDQLVSRALAEADVEPGSEPETGSEPATGQPGGPSPVVTPLAPARARRSAPPWLVAAAVVVLVAVGLGLVWSGQRDDRDQASDTAALAVDEDAGSGGGSDGSDQESATSEDEVSAGRGDDAPAAESDEAPVTGEAPPLTDGLRSLGDFPDEAALRSALASTVPTGRSTTSAEVPASDEVARCDTQVRHVFDLPDPPTATVLATIADEEVLVFGYERASFEDASTPTTFVTVVDPATCTPRLSFERDPG